MPTAARVTGIDGPIDHPFVMTGTAQVDAALGGCAAHGVPMVTVCGDGFAEAGSVAVGRRRGQAGRDGPASVDARSPFHAGAAPACAAIPALRRRERHRAGHACFSPVEGRFRDSAIAAVGVREQTARQSTEGTAWNDSSARFGSASCGRG